MGPHGSGRTSHFLTILELVQKTYSIFFGDCMRFLEVIIIKFIVKAKGLEVSVLEVLDDNCAL